MEIGLVVPPDDAHREQIIPLLGHKGEPWLSHIELSFCRPLDELETRFYIGKLHGTPIANIMTVEHNGVGILGHVWTVPEHRRKGACRELMARQMAHFRERGGRCLYLGTGYDTPPYWIYHSFGFRSVFEGTGFMVYTTAEDFREQYFAEQPALVEDLRWQHWATVAPLVGGHEGEILRNYMLRLLGPTNFEGPFLHLREQVEARAGAQAKVLVSESGAAVGLATLLPDPRWEGRVACLDLFIHPNFRDYTDQLLAAFDLAPAGISLVLAYVDAGAEYALDSLSVLGFERAGVLPEAARALGQAADVVVMALRR